MEIKVRSERRIVEIWLTREEKQNAKILEELKPLYQRYKDEGYLAVVYESGEQDLWNTTSDLLCYNRKRIAQMEIEQERQCGMVMEM